MLFRSNQQRITKGLPTQPIDEFLLSAMQAGLPDCAGVALGLDRLIMLALEQTTISQAMSFNMDNA